jgi:hypothetical protein
MRQRCIITARAIMSPFIPICTQALLPFRAGPMHGRHRRPNTIIRLIYPRLAANHPADVDELSAGNSFQGVEGKFESS